MKIFYRIAMAAVLILASFAASAQVAFYRLSVSPAPNMGFQPVAQMTIIYRPNGYDMLVNGITASVTTSNGVTQFNMSKLSATIYAGRDWWFPKQVGVWREAPVVTAYGDRGVMRIMYAGLKPYGRQYHDEMWLNGKLFSRTTTVLDHNDQIVWSLSADQEGLMRLDRL